MLQRHNIIPVFIPDLACPHQCVFCNQKNISGRKNIPDADEVASIIDTHLSTISAENHVEIGFFGGNFTGVERAKQKELLAAAGKYIRDGRIKSIRISTRPDYIDDEVLCFLKEHFVSVIELGAQSFDDNVLRLSGRGHQAQHTLTATKSIKEHGFQLGLQMMVGLPGDTIDQSILTARKIVQLNADNTRIYPVIVIKDTPLEKLFTEHKYRALSIDEAVLWVKEVYKIFEEAGIDILRVGLHPSEGLINKDVYVAGPFHVSFRELVLTELWKDALVSLLQCSENKKLVITVPESELNYAIGYGASNKKMLQTHFSHITFATDTVLKGRNYHAHHC